MDRKDGHASPIESLVRQRGTGWVVEQLIELGGPQVVLLHVANELANDPNTGPEASQIFGLIEKLDDQFGYSDTLDHKLWDFHANGYPHEPKPRVLEGFNLSFGDKSEVVIDHLRKSGYKIEGTEIAVRYKPNSDPYIGIDAADLQEEIWEIALRLGCSEKRSSCFVPIYGLGPGAA